MKKTTIAIAALVTMSFAGAAFAAQAPSGTTTGGNWDCPGYSQSYNNMTDEQRAQIATNRQQILEQRKQMIQQQADRGYITQDQANQRMSWMDQNMSNGAMMGPGMMGSGMGYGMGLGGHHMGGGMGTGMGNGMGSGMGYGGMMNSLSGTRL